MTFSSKDFPKGFLGALAALLLLPSLGFSQVFSTYGVQYPVWVERGETKLALGPGATVMAGDLLVTGKGGKAWVTMADGALVKLGENASLRANRAIVKEQGASETRQASADGNEVGLIEGSFDVVEGAFRYTTQKLNKIWERNIQIGLGTNATVGIRGTDLWGKVDATEQFVVLLEGVISVRPTSGGDEVELKTPLEIYTASNESVSTVEMSAVQALAPETELDFGQGVQVEEGRFQVYLASYETERAAKAVREKLGQNGLSARVMSAEVNGAKWYRLSVASVSSFEGAQALAIRASDQFGFSSPWVANY